MAPGDLQPHLEYPARSRTSLNFLQILGTSVISPSPGYPPFKSVNRGTQTQGQLMCSHPHTFPLTWILRCPPISTHAHSHTSPFPSPVLTHAQICLPTILPKCIPINKVTLKTHNHTHSQIHLHSHYAPTLTGSNPCGNTFRAFTPDTMPPPVPASPIPGTTTGVAPPPCTPPHPTHQHVHSYTPAAAESSTSGAPRPHNLRTPTGSCLKLPRLPSPSARGGPLSGYQEVKGECQEGGSSPLPVR